MFLFIVSFFLTQCGTKEIKEHINIEKYPHFVVTDEININDSCIYLLHPIGQINLPSIIQINPKANKHNTLLIEFDRDGSLNVKHSYEFHLESSEFPNLNGLEEPDFNLIKKSIYSDSFRLAHGIYYADYMFYLPKEDKLFWINVFDGISQSEQSALKWIERNITKISLKEDVYYRMLSEKKKSFTDINLEDLNRRYIIENKELAGLPLYFTRCRELLGKMSQEQ